MVKRWFCSTKALHGNSARFRKRMCLLNHHRHHRRQQTRQQQSIVVDSPSIIRSTEAIFSTFSMGALRFSLFAELYVYVCVRLTQNDGYLTQVYTLYAWNVQPKFSTDFFLQFYSWNFMAPIVSTKLAYIHQECRVIRLAPFSVCINNTLVVVCSHLLAIFRLCKPSSSKFVLVLQPCCIHRRRRNHRS